MVKLDCKVVKEIVDVVRDVKETEDVVRDGAKKNLVSIPPESNRFDLLDLYLLAGPKAHWTHHFCYFFAGLCQERITLKTKVERANDDEQAVFSGVA